MSTHAQEWWRPATSATALERPVTIEDRERVAFGALIAFTFILLVSPQAWFPAIKSLRIALLAAGVAAAAHLAARAFGRAPAMPVRREMLLAIGLIGWAALTIPLSIWPGGSTEQLTDHLIKAVVFFWLIGTLVTSEARFKLFAWTLSICSIPLAVTAINNYRAGVFVTHATSAVQRIAGYVGGSGLAGNPNDLALMLNLLLPVTGALFVISKSPAVRLLTGAALLLSVAAVIATFSRAGFITLAVIGVLTVFAMVRRGAVVTALGIAFLAAVALAAVPQQYYGRLATITNIEADPTGSAQGRWNDFVLSVSYIRSHPITGAGLGQDLLALNAARGHDTWRSVHNAYLQAAVDLGVPGATLFVALLAVSFQNARRVRRAAERAGANDLAVLAQSVSISLMAFTVAAFFHPIAYQFYFFCLAGMAVALVNVSRSRLALAS
ncbi:MAG TPA: O-antigen ligase family protein [Vicinamibacterales bacterium]|nr:O-antigen ligase family protein [Vicinamibacterales bacterium]